MTASGQTKHMHPFEQAGLGLGPFKFVGHYRDVGPKVMSDGMTTVGSPGQPLGVCDYCGTSIADCFEIKSSDGKMFIVGCDCVMKLYKASNATSDKVLHDIKAAANAAKTKARHEREDAKIAEGVAFIEANAEVLKKIAHPMKKFADQGQSYFDKVQWYLSNAGRAGKIEAIKLCRSMVAKYESGEANLLADAQVQRAAEIAEEKALKAKAEMELKQAYNEACQWVEDNSRSLDELPHGKGWRGKSKLNEAIWFRDNAGLESFLVFVMECKELVARIES